LIAHVPWPIGRWLGEGILRGKRGKRGKSILNAPGYPRGDCGELVQRWMKEGVTGHDIWMRTEHVLDESGSVCLRTRGTHEAGDWSPAVGDRFGALINRASLQLSLRTLEIRSRENPCLSIASVMRDTEPRRYR
jgi:hypothetical protein